MKTTRTAKFKKYLDLEVTKSLYRASTPGSIKTKSQIPISYKAKDYKQTGISDQSEEVGQRRRVHQTNQFPYSVHGVISADINKVRLYGTGILIGPRVVLTAGHNLYDLKTKAYAKTDRIQFLPGINGQKLPFGSVEVEKIFVSPNYTEEGKEDYGILILKKPIGEKTGYFGIACLEPDEIRSKQIHITGYPADKIASKSKTYEMWEMEGEKVDVDPDRGLINYLIETGPGLAGSGIWYQEEGNYYVCGIHVAGTLEKSSATLLTREIYTQMSEWMPEFSSGQVVLGDQVTELQFKDYQINDKCLSLLMKYPFAKLSNLDLSWKRIGKEGAKILAQNSSWTNLSRLDLNWNNIGDEGVKELAKNNSWINLAELSLNCNKISDEGVRALAQNTSWIKLSQLNLRGNNIDDQGAIALAKNTSWIYILELDFRDNNIGFEGAKALTLNTSWLYHSKLKLKWDQSYKSHSTLQTLENYPELINPSKLNLDLSKNGVDGTQTLAEYPIWLNNPSEFNLTHKITNDEGTRVLRNSELLMNIQPFLSVKGAKIAWSHLTSEAAVQTEQPATKTIWTDSSYADLDMNNDLYKFYFQSPSFNHQEQFTLHKNYDNKVL